MKIYHEELSDVTRYIQNHKGNSLDHYEHQYQGYLRPIEQLTRIDSSTRILEVGTGPGWFPILCKMRGLQCKGLEISPQLIEYAKEWGRSLGVDPDIELGNLEDSSIGDSAYDIIITSNVFEHVEDWRKGVRRVYAALKPGGVMFFESTNKFSFTSGEYSFPLYGWLPDSMRYKMRIAAQGPDIMKLGIDFHQFRHSLLRREFQRIGFTKVLDRVEIAREDMVSSGFRRAVVRASRQIRPLKALALTFSDATRFLCVK
jgi:SAM-dependent methyltransferase